MKSNTTLLLTALAAGSLVACGPAIGKDTSTISSMATNATSHVSHMFGGGGGTSSAMKEMEDKLGLSDDQKQKVESLFGSTHQQVKDLKDNTSLSTDEKKSKLGEIRDSMNTKLQSILTPDQYSKWQKLTHETSSVMPKSSSPP